MKTGGCVISNSFHFINESFLEVFWVSKSPGCWQGLIKGFLCHSVNAAEVIDFFAVCQEARQKLCNGRHKRRDGSQRTIAFNKAGIQKSNFRKLGQNILVLVTKCRLELSSTKNSQVIRRTCAHSRSLDGPPGHHVQIFAPRIFSKLHWAQGPQTFPW